MNRKKEIDLESAWEQACLAVTLADKVRPNPYASTSVDIELKNAVAALCFELAPAPDDAEGHYERAHTTLNYGTLPHKTIFKAVFSECCAEGFSFENDERVGDCTLSCAVLWRQLCKAVDELENENSDAEDSPGNSAGSWASCVLSLLGFEWV